MQFQYSISPNNNVNVPPIIKTWIFRHTENPRLFNHPFSVYLFPIREKHEIYSFVNIKLPGAPITFTVIQRGTIET